MRARVKGIIARLQMRIAAYHDTARHMETFPLRERMLRLEWVYRDLLPYNEDHSYPY